MRGDDDFLSSRMVLVVAIMVWFVVGVVTGSMMSCVVMRPCVVLERLEP